MSCKQKHTDIQNIMSQLPYSQKGLGRHKCAACAFEEGYKDGLKGIKREIDKVVFNLPESQSKNQRHKSCEMAYEKGFDIGYKVKKSIDFSIIVNNKRISGFNIPPKPKLLHLYKLDDRFAVGVFQGSISEYDMIVKFRQFDNNKAKWSLFRQPKHIHWTVDVLIKQEYSKDVISKFLQNLLADWDDTSIIPHLKDKREREEFLRPEKLLRYVFIEAEQYNNEIFRGEYPFSFLILISRVLMAQERTNNRNAYMFKELLETLKEHKDLYTIISKATYNGK